MTTSSSSRDRTSSLSVSPVIAAGNISHTARGASSLLTRSSNEEAPTTRSPSSFSTAATLTSSTTQLWPSRTSRCVRFAPIRPRPTIPSCIGRSVVMGVLIPLQSSIQRDQFIRRGVVSELWLDVGFQLRDDGNGQDFAQLYSPLIEGVDAPDRSLREHRMLVEGDEQSEDPGRQNLREQHVGRTITFHHAMRNHVLRRSFGAHLVGRLAESQRLGLSEDVGRKDVVMRTQRIETLGKADEVDRNDRSALMD